MCSLVQITLLVVAIVSGGQSRSLSEASGFELVFGKFGQEFDNRFNHLDAEMRELKGLVLNRNLGLTDAPRVAGEKNPAGVTDVDPFTTTESSRETSERHNLTVLGKTFEVLYEQNEHGVDWIVIQSRFDGSVDFYRNWTEYRDGFGSLDGEFWLGLENIHLLTASKDYELLILLESFDGETKYARYGKFAIGGENKDFVLKTLESFSGTAGDSSDRPGQKFSTYDRDNDIYQSGNCAESHKGGWWYKDCSFINLNGLWNPESKGLDTMHWYKFNKDVQCLKTSRMMIKELMLNYIDE